ncbi:MAG: aldo/keto reductase [Pseudomonadota bacterium]
MDSITLGRTGLTVSVAGLGCGGHSRLGQRQGRSKAHSVALVQAALDAGVSFIDTAAAYGTEEIVGEALRGRRDAAVVSTKIGPYLSFPKEEGPRITGADLIARADAALARLGTDYIDILHLHGVSPSDYPHCRDELAPALIKLREAGKIRFTGITERFIDDTRHAMLAMALPDDLWDVVMVGFSLLNPSARHTIFPLTQAGNVGTLIMFAVRRALSQPEAMVELIDGLVARGELDPAAFDPSDPLGYLAQPEVAGSIIEAAYRFCRHEPGAHVVLTGTGSPEHLAQNIASINRPPLPQATHARLAAQFGRIDSVSGN